jgi:hypothetical protein
MSFQTDQEVHPASSKVGIGTFPEVKLQKRDAEHPPPSKAEVADRVELYILLQFVSAYQEVKGKGKGHPRTGHEGPEGGSVVIALFFL